MINFFEKIQDDNRWKNTILLSFIMNGVALLFFLFLFYPRFYSNIDILMQNAIYGIGGIRTSYIVFSNLFVGKALTTLMFFLPEVPWYVVFHYGWSFFSLYIISYLTLKRNPSAMGRVIVGVILVFLGYECYVEPNYMKTAAVMCVSAIYLAFYLYNEEKKNISKWCVVVLLCVMSSMISFYTSLLCGGICSFSVVSYMILTKKNKSKAANLRGLKVLIVILVFIAGMRFLDSYMYQETERLTALKYRDAYEKVMSFGYPSGDESIYEKYDIDEDKYKMLTQGYFLSGRGEPLDNILRISNEKKELSWESIVSYFRTVPLGLFNTGIIYYLIVLFFFHGFMHNKKSGLVAYCCLGFLMVIFFLYMQNCYSYKWISFIIGLSMSILLLMDMERIVLSELKVTIVYLIVFGIVLYSKFASELPTAVEKKDIASVYNTEKVVETDVLFIDMVEYLRKYSVLEVQEMPYEYEHVYCVNGGYALFESFYQWNELTDLDESRSYGWLYNPNEIKKMDLHYE